MKTGAKKILKSSFKLTFLFVLCCTVSNTAFAQDNQPTNEQEVDSLSQEIDSVKTGFDLGRIKMADPESIVSKYVYDPTLDAYIYSQKVGNFDIGYPIILTPEQYMELVRKEGIKDYFKAKSDAVSGKKEGSEEARKNLLPNFYVNNDFFQKYSGAIP